MPLYILFLFVALWYVIKYFRDLIIITFHYYYINLLNIWGSVSCSAYRIVCVGSSLGDINGCAKPRHNAFSYKIVFTQSFTSTTNKTKANTHKQKTIFIKIETHRKQLKPRLAQMTTFNSHKMQHLNIVLLVLRWSYNNNQSPKPQLHIYKSMINSGLLTGILNSWFDFFFYTFRIRDVSYISYLRDGS